MRKYIVAFVDKKNNMVDHLGQLEDDGILWNAGGGTVTLFDNYDEARKAVKRTRTYAKKEKMPWFDYWGTAIYRAGC